MSQYPTPELPIPPEFNPLTFQVPASSGLTIGQADLRYLKLSGGAISGTLAIAGQTAINDLTDSTSITTGSLILKGGLGIAKTLYVGTGIDANSGTVSSPSYSFASSATSGLYLIGANNIGISCNGIKQLDISTTLIQPTNPIRFSTNWNTIIQNSNGLTGMYFTPTPGIGFTTNNGSRLEMSSNGCNFYSQVQGKNGAVNDPSYSWFNEQSSGLYRASTNDLRFSVNSTDKWKWTSSGNISLQQLDMNSNNIINCPKVGNTAGDITIECNTTGVGGNIKLSGGTGLISNTSGGVSGQHLVLTINGVQYKIELRNP